MRITPPPLVLTGSDAGRDSVSTTLNTFPELAELRVCEPDARTGVVAEPEGASVLLYPLLLDLTAELVPLTLSAVPVDTLLDCPDGRGVD